MPALHSTGWLKYSAVDITTDDSAPTEVSATKPSVFLSCGGSRSARLRFYLNADDATLTDLTVFLGYTSNNRLATSPRGSATDVMYHTKELCILTGTITAGTKVGVAGANATAGENWVDLPGTLAVSAWGQKVMNHVNGTIDVYSEAEQIGELLISDLANADYLHLVFDLGTATLANAEVRLDT